MSKTILQVLFPRVRAELFRLLFDPPLKRRYVRELARLSGLALHTVQDELRRLVAVGVVKGSSDGYHRFYAANREHPLGEHFLKIVQLAAKMKPIQGAVLARTKSNRLAKRGRPKPRRLAPDRPHRWNIFSQHATTRRGRRSR